MRSVDLLKDAINNSARNKIRTSLTVLAIFVGAFTLTLTNGIGTGVSSYIDNQVNSIGSPTVVTITNPSKTVDDPEGPKAYEANNTASQIPTAASFGLDIEALTQEDVKNIEKIENIDYVELTYMPRPDFIQGKSGEPFTMDVNFASSVMVPDLTAGRAFKAKTNDFEVLLPATYVEPLGYLSDAAAIGETVSLQITDSKLQHHILEATVVGVQNKSIFGETISLNPALSETIGKLQTPDTNEKTYWSVIGHFSENLDAQQQKKIKDEIQQLGFEGSTIADQLGSVNAVINGIIAILNGFGLIALIAAGFGIVNTLLMSVQERTREIGLMKAMGMSGGKIYALFSLEAVFIGFLGSALGSGAAIFVGSTISRVLSSSVLSDLPGLSITLFTVPSIAGVLATVMFIAFLAGTIPAHRAAKQNPIDALRYE